MNFDFSAPIPNVAPGEVAERVLSRIGATTDAAAASLFLNVCQVLDTGGDLEAVVRHVHPSLRRAKLTDKRYRQAAGQLAPYVTAHGMLQVHEWVIC